MIEDDDVFIIMFSYPHRYRVKKPENDPIKVFEKLDKNKEKFSFLDSNITDTLSGGQKKLIHLLRIEFNSNSKICILDEPTNGLDSISRNNVIEFIKQLNKNKTIIIITHDSYFKEFSSQIINL